TVARSMTRCPPSVAAARQPSSTTVVEPASVMIAGPVTVRPGGSSRRWCRGTSRQAPPVWRRTVRGAPAASAGGAGGGRAGGRCGVHGGGLDGGRAVGREGVRGAVTGLGWLPQGLRLARFQGEGGVGAVVAELGPAGHLDPLVGHVLGPQLGAGGGLQVVG